jgi:hypothetical protein
LTRPGKGLVRDVRGAAIYVELLLVFPVIAVLWMFALYSHRLGDSRVHVQRQARTCSWALTTGGSRAGASAGCEVEGPSRLAGAELDQVAGTGLENVVRPIATLRALFRRPAGDEVTTRDSGTVTPPAIFGSAATTRGMKRMTRNELLRAPQLPAVVQMTCRGLLGPGGKCP